MNLQSLLCKAVKMFQTPITEVKSSMISSITTDNTFEDHHFRCSPVNSIMVIWGFLVVFFFFTILIVTLRKIIMSTHIFPLQQIQLKPAAGSCTFTDLIAIKFTTLPNLQLDRWLGPCIQAFKPSTQDTAGTAGMTGALLVVDQMSYTSFW